MVNSEVIKPGFSNILLCLVVIDFFLFMFPLKNGFNLNVFIKLTRLKSDHFVQVGTRKYALKT